jgi:mannose/cellobiose epimerase-like protein (N-acyl-D-glucosamine 2-epimerase family)
MAYIEENEEGMWITDDEEYSVVVNTIFKKLMTNFYSLF